MRPLQIVFIVLFSFPVFAKGPALQLPARLKGKAVVLAPSDPAYPRAKLEDGVKPPGGGGLLAGIVVQIKQDVTVYRLYNGPTWKDARGNNNRFGQWWAYDSLRGTQTDFRRDYEVCQSWNNLTWAVKCTLKKGAVVAIGPGNSVNESTCNRKGESYPVNHRDWQIWIAEAYNRNGAGKELVCPGTAKDYRVDLRDISRAQNAGAKKPPARAAAKAARP